jgi:hypothetical protein
MEPFGLLISLVVTHKELQIMAKNTGKGSRKGAVKERTQFETPGGNYAKRDTESGEIMDVKATEEAPFKGVAKESDDRRSGS